MERSNGEGEDSQDDDDGEEGDEDQDDATDHDPREETIELFGGQDPKKLARIIKNLLGLGVKNREIQRQIALREANRTIYTDICTALSVNHDNTLPKHDLHNLVIGAVSSLLS